MAEETNEPASGDDEPTLRILNLKLEIQSKRLVELSAWKSQLDALLPTVVANHQALIRELHKVLDAFPVFTATTNSQIADMAHAIAVQAQATVELQAKVAKLTGGMN